MEVKQSKERLLSKDKSFPIIEKGEKKKILDQLLLNYLNSTHRKGLLSVRNCKKM